MLSAINHVQLRQLALQWAAGTSSEGESAEAVLARAEAFLSFVLYPMRPDVVQAMVERQLATVQ